MLIGLLLLACTGLSGDGIAARTALDAALQARDPDRVSTAARAAAPWREKDPALDRLLGDALANVLMKPEDGLVLLEANPAPQDPKWREALQGAALRSGDRAAMARAWSAAGRDAPDFHDPLFDQASARARRDPHFALGELDATLDACSVLAQRPRIGRQAFTAPVPPNLFAAARALGATEIAMGRSPYPTDPPVDSGTGLWECADLRVMPGDEVPAALPTHVVVVGATDGKVAVYLELRIEDGAPWIFNASDAGWAARWVRAASLLAEGGEAKVKSELGMGIQGTAFPKPAAGSGAAP